MRSVSLVRHIDTIDPAAWKTVNLDRDGNYRKPQVVDEEATLSNYPGTARQLTVTSPARAFEDFIADLVGSQVDSGSASRQGAAAFYEISAKHGVEFVKR